MASWLKALLLALAMGAALMPSSAGSGEGSGWRQAVDRLGHERALAEGCDADIVLLSGDPFDLTTRVEAVWVDGKQRINTQAISAGEEKR